jgi:hypothetical protein
MIYDDRDDGMREQRQNEISDYSGSVEDDRDFEIVIDDENIEPNWDILIEKFEDEEFLKDEIENNLEKNK